MNGIRQKVYDVLDGMGVRYEVTEHPAVYTIEEMDLLGIDGDGEVVKNLFIRDDKKKRFFLVILKKDKMADLKGIRSQLNCRPLSFASEESLQKCLGLSKGAVTPFGVLNDTEKAVEVVLDKDILEFERVGVHPNENTATVWIRPGDLVSVIRNHGNALSYIEI